MKQSKWKTYVFWIGLSEGIGLLSGFLSRNATASFGESALQSPLSPPAIVFPIVWTILYALMGIGVARISLTPQSAQRSKSLNLYFTQLVVNFFWSLIFRSKYFNYITLLVFIVKITTTFFISSDKYT